MTAFIVADAPTLAEAFADLSVWDPCAIQSRRAAHLGRQVAQARAAAQRQERLETFVWLHEQGDVSVRDSRAERCRQAAPRLGMSWRALERMLDRHGDPMAQRLAS